nr:asparagine synthase-related protein [Candidatus Chloroploca mongolica]
MHLGSDEAYLEAFHGLFSRIVADHLVSPTPVALQVINPQFAAQHGVPELAHHHDDRLWQRFSRDPRRVRYDALVTQDFGPYISAYRARFGVDMRSPTADVRLAEFCLALPETQFWRNGESRSLVRRAFAGQLPSSVLRNRLRGMQAADWFERLSGAREQFHAELERLERSDLACQVLDLTRMRELLERLPASAGATRTDYITYQGILQRGFMIGAFLCWFEAGAL